MSISTDADLLLDSLHEACEYIPKRAIRHFTDTETRPSAVSLLLEEMEEVLHNSEHYVEMESQFLFHAMLILAHLKEKDAIPLFRSVGHLDPEAIEQFFGDRLYDSIALSYAELMADEIETIKDLIEDEEQEPVIRTTLLQAMVILFGKGVLSRDAIIEYFLEQLKKRQEKIPYFYDLIAVISTVLHPEEMIDELRAAFAEGYIDAHQVTFNEVEEALHLPKEEAIEHAKGQFNDDLEDLVAHHELISKKTGFERNDPCPCCSGLKYKKCCY